MLLPPVGFVRVGVVEWLVELLLATSRKTMQMEMEMRVRNLLGGEEERGVSCGLDGWVGKRRGGWERRGEPGPTDLPVEDMQRGDLVRERQDRFGRGDAELCAFSATGLGDEVTGWGGGRRRRGAPGRPGEVDHENCLVVLAEHGQGHVAEVMFVEASACAVLLVDLLQLSW